MGYKIINAISSAKVPKWGNQKKYIAVHYLGVDGQNHDLSSDGCGAHYYIYWDGTIYQRCSHDAIPWAVGTGGYYTQIHPKARNSNTISIEMCCHCDGNTNNAEDKKWWFTAKTQEACVWLVQKLMRDLNIPIKNVLRHRDIVNKTCPAPYVHNNKYRTSWTWDEFRAKVASVEIKSDPLYKVRKTWKDEKTQIFAGTLEGAKNACAIGYSVFDENGNVVYTNKNTSADDNIDKIWMGWVKRETGSAGLRCIHGDAGKAYGMQFDYRYGLIDFLKYCIEYNPARYVPFNKFVSLGKGSSKLVYNQELGKLWQQFYDKYTTEFEALQYTCAYKNYYLPVKQYLKKLYGINLDNHSPAVKGTAWSMSFRSGQEAGAKKFAGCNDSTSDSEMLRIAYSKYGSSDANRWTKNGQWGDAVKALNSNTYTGVCKELTNNNSDNDPTNESIPPKTPSEKELLYRVGTDWKDGRCQNQTNAYTILSNAKKDADTQSKVNKSTYCVFDANGTKIYTSTYKESKFEPYNVRVKIPDLRIRDAANGNIIYNKTGSEKVTGIGVFGIIEEKKAGKYTWGRLLSKAGWIALSSDYVQKL